MARVIWSDQAADDLDQIILYLQQFDPVAAADIGSRLFRLGESLAHFPHRGRPARAAARGLTTVAPYVLRYLVDGERVVVVHVRHGARRPV